MIYKKKLLSYPTPEGLSLLLTHLMYFLVKNKQILQSFYRQNKIIVIWKNIITILEILFS